MIAGIVLDGAGHEEGPRVRRGHGHYELSDPLARLPLWALYGGIALYLLGHVGFRWRTGTRSG